MRHTRARAWVIRWLVSTCTHHTASSPPPNSRSDHSDRALGITHCSAYSFLCPRLHPLFLLLIPLLSASPTGPPTHSSALGITHWASYSFLCPRHHPLGLLLTSRTCTCSCCTDSDSSLSSKLTSTCIECEYVCECVRVCMCAYVLVCVHACVRACACECEMKRKEGEYAGKAYPSHS